MSDAPQILDRIHALLAEDNDIEVPRATLAALPWKDTGLDSLPLMELVLHLEQEYDCTVSNEALREVVTFGDLAVILAQEMR